jgi:hypothetical protein
MAGHKGYAISVLMDVLSGVLTGSEFGPGVFGPYQAEKRSGAGHLMIALNIEIFQPLAAFNTRMETMIAGLKSAPLAKASRKSSIRERSRRGTTIETGARAFCFQPIRYPTSRNSLTKWALSGYCHSTYRCDDHRDQRRRGACRSTMEEERGDGRGTLLSRPRRTLCRLVFWLINCLKNEL